jgi:EAL domain-containing protein (putative c-di-GMP-specific phosphodiesterase class I)
MAKGLDLRVVAEGVENRDQLNFLTTQGCDLAQGFLLAKPMDGDDYLSHLKNLQVGIEPLRPSATRSRRTNSTS